MNFNSLRKEIISNNASVKELVNDIFTRIDNKDPEINSFVCTTKAKAIAQALPIPLPAPVTTAVLFLKL